MKSVCELIDEQDYSHATLWCKMGKGDQVKMKVLKVER